MIGIHRAAGQSDMKRSGYLHRGLPVQRKGKRKRTGNRAIGRGYFFKIQEELQKCVFRVGMRDRIQLHKQDLAEVEAQRREKSEKEKIAKKLSLKNSQKMLIEAIYLFNQYNSKEPTLAE